VVVPMAQILCLDWFVQSDQQAVPQFSVLNEQRVLPPFDGQVLDHWR
jgi:hypothetical protein